ncbi:MAG TPA: SPOR domain-containing protein [Bacteroidales bacterium]|jgi:Sporulation related domain.
MKIIITLCFSLLNFPFYICAQTNTTVTTPYIISNLQRQEGSQGHVQVIQDKRIDELLNKIIERNAKKGTIRGYRIQIYRGNSQVAQQRAIAARSKFLEKFPDVDAYIVVKAPWWSVYVGNFRTITDAFRMLKEIEPLFPNAFYVREDIDYNKL